jgi:hypothetical protein
MKHMCPRVCAARAPPPSKQSPTVHARCRVGTSHAGGSSGTVGVLRTVANGMTRSEVTTTPTTTAAASVDDELAWRADPTASLLVACGYPPGPVCAALAAAAGDQVAALLTLTRQLTAGCTLDAAALMPKLVYAGDSSQGGSRTVGADGGDASGSVPLSEPWVEECQVLESIYGEQLVVEPGGGLRLGLQAETPVRGGEAVHVAVPVSVCTQQANAMSCAGVYVGRTPPTRHASKEL